MKRLAQVLFQSAAQAWRRLTRKPEDPFKKCGGANARARPEATPGRSCEAAEASRAAILVANGSAVGMTGFEHIVPGWKQRVARPYDGAVERGLRSLINRWKGKQFAVIALVSELDFDGLSDDVLFDHAFTDLDCALICAQECSSALYRGHRAKHCNWKATEFPGRDTQWPAPSKHCGHRVLALLPQGIDDGSGYNRWSVRVSVWPIDPITPITAEFLDAIASRFDSPGIYSADLVRALAREGCPETLDAPTTSEPDGKADTHRRRQTARTLVSAAAISGNGVDRADPSPIIFRSRGAPFRKNKDNQWIH